MLEAFWWARPKIISTGNKKWVANAPFLSTDSFRSALIVGLKEEGEELFSKSLEEMEELKVWEC